MRIDSQEIAQGFRVIWYLKHIGPPRPFLVLSLRNHMEVCSQGTI